MTKDRLRNFSYEELSKIAENGKISVLQNSDKETLVNVIYEALEEDRADREQIDNMTIRIEAKKYAVSQDEELFLDFEDPVELSSRYGETRLVLMLRDPSWVYCYWDLEDRVLESVQSDGEVTGLVLRVNELAAPDWGKDSAVDWFDIPIQFDDLSRYINLPSEDSFYGVELFVQLGEKEELITRSNIVESSRDYVAPARASDEDERRDLLIELAGFSTDIGAFPGTNLNETQIPQRIIGIGDSDEGEY